MPDRPLIDISRPISESIAVWPGDTRFSRRTVMAIPDGCPCNVSTFTLSAHTGAHADAPSHFIHDAAAIDQVDLGAYVGRCRVIEVRDPVAVRLADIEGLDLRAEERLLFRTPFPLSHDTWRDDFTFVSIEVAERAARAGLRLLGIDTPSVDPMRSKTLDAHKTLLRGGVAILEGLDLSLAPAGVYELIALPLRVAGADASPVRAVLRPLA